jgi:hypothetical protein
MPKFMTMRKSTLTLLLLWGFLNSAMASQPVTLTDFHRTFNYLDEVQLVLDHGAIDGRVIGYLTDQNNPIDEKAGIINALVVNNKTHSNALTFKQFVARKYKEDWQSLSLDKLTADELFCLGYLSILDNDGKTDEGLPMLELAVQKNPYSYTIQLFHALAVASQSIASGNPCKGWETCQAVKTNTTLNNDLDASVATLIYDVMESYNSGCE